MITLISESVPVAKKEYCCDGTPSDVNGYQTVLKWMNSNGFFTIQTTDPKTGNTNRPKLFWGDSVRRLEPEERK